LAYELEAIGLSVEDANDLSYNFDESVFEYVNTFAVEKSLTSFGGWNLALGVENELVVPDGDIEDSISVGPSISNGMLSFSVVYVAAVAPELSHGVGGGVGLAF